MLQHGLTDIVAVKPPALPGVGWGEGRAIGAVEQSPQKCGSVGACSGGAFARAFRQDGVNLVPDIAVDDRSLDVLRAEDLLPFEAGIKAGAEAVMMAHVTYSQVAPEPAGYSPRWLNEILRHEMGFRGVIFSDDIGMAAATGVGGVGSRIAAHLDAGCDVVLVCAPTLVADSLKACEQRIKPDTSILQPLMGRDEQTLARLQTQSRYHVARAGLTGPDYAVS